MQLETMICEKKILNIQDSTFFMYLVNIEENKLILIWVDWIKSTEVSNWKEN